MVSIRAAVSTARRLSLLRDACPSLSQGSRDRADVPAVLEKIPAKTPQLPHSAVPSRVTIGKPLKVKKSSIPEAGRGLLFVENKTEEGEMRTKEHDLRTKKRGAAAFLWTRPILEQVLRRQSAFQWERS
jgi:hypothetical protein